MGSSVDSPILTCLRSFSHRCRLLVAKVRELICFAFLVVVVRLVLAFKLTFVHRLLDSGRCLLSVQCVEPLCDKYHDLLGF